MKKGKEMKVMRKYRLLVTAVAVAIVLSNGYAAEKPRSLATDRRIKVISYQPNQVYPVQANTFIDTQIKFGANEVIEEIQNGDLTAWEAKVPKGLSNMLFIKPTIENSSTNMTVVTNKRTYYFYLESESAMSNKLDATYAIEFVYPEDVKRTLEAEITYNKQQKKSDLNAGRLPHRYNWNYSFNGDATIMPLHVFDDGHFTYMQLRNCQNIPAIFSVDNRKGEEAVVNYRRSGQYIVIQRISPQLTLRDGKHHVASVFDNTLIRKLNRRG